MQKLNLKTIFRYKFFLFFLPVFLGHLCLVQHCFGTEILAEFSIPTGGDCLTVPVKFNGKTYLFLVDTGATVTVYDTSLKSYLGKPIKTESILTADGKIDMDFFASPNATLGPLNMQTDRFVLCHDFTLMRQILGKRIYGIVGMDFLKTHLIQINFDLGVLTFLNGPHFQSPLPPAPQHPVWGEGSVLKYSQQSIPVISAIVSKNTKVAFMVDTGDNSTGSLRKDLFDFLEEKNAFKSKIPLLSATVNGTKNSYSGCLEYLSLGSFEHHDQYFSRGDLSALGLDYFSRYLVTFDFPNQMLYLKKGSDYLRPDYQDMSGLHLIRKDGQVIVHSAQPGSPAEMAGLRTDDVVLTINNMAATEYDFFSLGRFLSFPEGKKIKLKIQRGQITKSVSFQLKNMSQPITAKPSSP